MIGLDGWKQREQEMENNEMVTNGKMKRENRLVARNGVCAVELH